MMVVSEGGENCGRVGFIKGEEGWNIREHMLGVMKWLLEKV